MTPCLEGLAEWDADVVTSENSNFNEQVVGDFKDDYVKPPVNSVNGNCDSCDLPINMHRVMYVDHKNEIKNFNFCRFETGKELHGGEDPKQGYEITAHGHYCRYLYIGIKPMNRKDFEDLYGS